MRDTSVAIRRARTDAGAVGILPYALLYLPVGLAWGTSFDPVLSFGIAWAGSLWILALSLSGSIKPLPADRSMARQILRPLILLQVLFAGYYCLGSVFHVWGLVATSSYSASAGEELALLAAAQRYYLLSHAALVHGILVVMDYRRSGAWRFKTSLSRARLTMTCAVVAFVVAVGVAQVPGLGQFAIKLERLSGAAFVVGFGFAIRDGDWSLVSIGSVGYGYLLFQALLSGWKHRVVVLVILLLAVLYPVYKRKVVIAGVAAGLLLTVLLPAYNGIFRKLHWGKGVPTYQAAEVAIERIQEGRVDLRKEAWHFLSGRVTRVQLFTNYIQHTPSQHPYYGFEIASRAVRMVVPGVLWPEKPSLERVAMQRAYENGAVGRSSNVSAKPSVIVDGYLSGGAVGVFLSIFLLGVLASLASRYCETWFGGYELGGQVVFPGLFISFLLTHSFEFLFNSVFWSVVLLVLLFAGLRTVDLLRRVPLSGARAK